MTKTPRRAKKQIDRSRPTVSQKAITRPKTTDFAADIVDAWRNEIHAAYETALDIGETPDVAITIWLDQDRLTVHPREGVRATLLRHGFPPDVLHRPAEPGTVHIVVSEIGHTVTFRYRLPDQVITVNAPGGMS